MTELDGVNEVLRKAGGYPVTVLDEGGASSAAEAQRCLAEESRKIQSTGWNFNTRRKVELTPVGGYIDLPTGTIHADSDFTDEWRNLTHRGERLYDLDNNTAVFSAAVYVKLVELWEFHCVPEPIANYIACSAALAFNSIRGDRTRERMIYSEKERARSEARVWNNRQLDANYVQGSDARDVMGERTTYRNRGQA
jgi:hypothetical protein